MINLLERITQKEGIVKQAVTILQYISFDEKRSNLYILVYVFLHTTTYTRTMKIKHSN